MSWARVLWTVPIEARATAANARTGLAARWGLARSANATRWLARLSAKAPRDRVACACRLQLGLHPRAVGLVGRGKQHCAPVQRDMSVAPLVQEAGARVSQAVKGGVVEAAAHQHGQPSGLFVGSPRVAADGVDLNPIKRRPMA